MISARIRYARMKSILEVPISNEKFWSKVPSAPADAIMMDLEDSATPDNKVVVREKILDALKGPEYFGGRQIIVRVNNLATPWGRDDLEAMAAAPGDLIICTRNDHRIEADEPVTDHTRLLHEASEAGEITLGDRFPRLLTGQWHFTPEHQDQLDTIDEQLQAMMDDLEVLWIAAGCPKVDDR